MESTYNNYFIIYFLNIVRTPPHARHLPGAFLEAGVQSVLVSIPKAADDATFQFMVSYHDHRLDGKSPLAALQETQRAMLTDARYPPRAWIGFTVYGCQ